MMLTCGTGFQPVFAVWNRKSDSEQDLIFAPAHLHGLEARATTAP